jgi:hypothetical protein
MKTNLSKYKVDYILVGLGLLMLLLLLVTELGLYRYGSYWEGRGFLPQGGWFLLLGLSSLTGVPFLIIFGIRLCARIKKDPIIASVARIVLGISLLVAPWRVYFAGLELATSLPMPQEPGMVRFAKGFRDRIDKRCDPEEIRVWAKPYLEAAGKHADYYVELKGKRVPHFVKKIYPISPLGRSARVIVRDGTVKMLWGSPLPGHWGLVIGPRDMVREEGMGHDGTESVCYFKWKQGIYIWHSQN